MTTWLVYAMLGAVLFGIGLYGLIARAHLLRRILSFNVAGSGIFLLFGATGARVADAPFHLGTDPVPQALIITGIVVSFSASAFAIALVGRIFDLSGRAALPEDDLHEES